MKRISKEDYLTEQANLTNQMLIFSEFDPRIKAKYGTSDAIDAQKSSIKKQLLIQNPELAKDPIALEAAVIEEFNNKFSNDLLNVFTGVTYKEPEEKGSRWKNRLSKCRTSYAIGNAFKYACSRNHVSSTREHGPGTN
jgi:hypothetical protein